MKGTKPYLYSKIEEMIEASELPRYAERIIQIENEIIIDRIIDRIDNVHIPDKIDQLTFISSDHKKSLIHINIIYTEDLIYTLMSDDDRREMIEILKLEKSQGRFKLSIPTSKEADDWYKIIRLSYFMPGLHLDSVGDIYNKSYIKTPDLLAQFTAPDLKDYLAKGKINISLEEAGRFTRLARKSYWIGQKRALLGVSNLRVAGP